MNINLGNGIEVSQEEMIEKMEKNLEKVKKMHDPSKSTKPDVCEEYIKYAEAQLEAVKNGIDPYSIEVERF